MPHNTKLAEKGSENLRHCAQTKTNLMVVTGDLSGILRMQLVDLILGHRMLVLTFIIATCVIGPQIETIGAQRNPKVLHLS